MNVLPASKEAFSEAVSVIHSGGIIAHATETCYGLACDLTNEEAVQKLFKLKKRPDHLPVNALFPSVEEIKKWVEWNAKAEELARKHWPGPLTLVLPFRKSVQNIVHLFPCPRSATATIGVRLSSHPIAQMLAELCGVPLSTTSANIHGKPEPYSVEEIVEQLSGQELQPDLILDSGKLPRVKPSTVVVVSKDGFEIVRQGGLILS